MENLGLNKDKPIGEIITNSNFNPEEAHKKIMEQAKNRNLINNIVLMTKFSPVPFADNILNQTPIIYDKHKRFWRYNHKTGLYTDDAEQFIRTSLRRNLMGDEQQKKAYVEEIVSYIKDTKNDMEFEPNSDPYLIPFNNKLFNIKTGEFLEYSPEHFITNKIHIDIDEKITTCPLIDKFFEDSVGKELKSILYDLPAYCLFRDTPYQKVFFVFGPAGSGKSRYMEFLEKFLGKVNHCSVEPKSIQKDKHSTSQMWLKLANIVSDIDYDALENINLIKKLSGGDTITIRKMYQEGFDERLFAKQIFSTNKLPAVAEKTRAWYRRVYPILFANIVEKEKVNPHIIDEITTKEEMQGFAWVAIQRLREMYKHKFVFEIDINEDEIAKVYEELSNPILLFINDNCIVDRVGWVFKYEFEERLANWLKVNHFPALTKSQINSYMRDMYHESNREAFGDKTYRVWVGLRWNNMGESSTINQFNLFNEKIKRVYIYRDCFSKGTKSVNAVNEEPGMVPCYICSRLTKPENNINGQFLCEGCKPQTEREKGGETQNEEVFEEG